MSNFKQCGKCKESKELSQFHKNKAAKDGLRYKCKECACEASKTWNATNPEKARAKKKSWYAANPNKKRDRQLKRKYGIDLNQYNQLFANQSGCCAICGKHQTEFKRKLAVDHCHTTGEVRGLLCSNCNQGIGYLKDSDELFSAASQYLNNDSSIALCNVVKLPELKLSGAPNFSMIPEFKEIFSKMFTSPL